MRGDINPNWQRWVRASIAQHFRDKLGNNLPLFLEGDVRGTDELENYCELRIDGPDQNRLSPQLYKLEVIIDVLVVNKKSSKNVYIFDTNIGLVSNAFTVAIQVLKYGNGPDDGPDTDNPSELGCLKQASDPARDKIIVSRFGQAKPELELQEATVEMSYEILISV